ncbi:MAG TPA: sigma-70 family RNA polymerase sigma factor [Candidatus Paceibacterota bacterium]
MNSDDLKKQFNLIYQSQSDAVLRFCLMRVSSREEAVDLTEEVFTRLWQTLISGKKLDNARAFIFTVARHLIIDWYRKKKSIPFEELEDKETGEAYDPVDEKALQNIEISAEGRFLIEAVSKLSPTYRQAVYLRFVEDLSPGEIGEVLGVSANAVSVRINRGVEELRKITGYDDLPNNILTT